MGQSWTVWIAYPLLNSNLPGFFGQCWCCLPSVSNSWPLFVALPIGLLDSLTLPLTNFSKSNITPEEHTVSFLHFEDCSSTLILNTTRHCLYTNLHSTSILYGIQVCSLPIGLSGTCALLFLFQKLGVLPVEEPWPVPISVHSGMTGQMRSSSPTLYLNPGCKHWCWHWSSTDWLLL